ncbi:hypothetical protein X737_30605 [Mesorhizobium sp. L48C026A00]|nr:hypothetical protein X737_30605 [Mesorhizobium sp. L48C026A00]
MPLDRIDIAILEALHRMADILRCADMAWIS